MSTTRVRQTCAVCFGTDSQQLPLVPQVQPDFWNKQFPGASSKAAFLYVDTGTTAQQAKSWEQAYAKDGFTWVLNQPIGISESNYTPYVVKMQQAGVQYVQFLGAYQEAATLAQAMQQQGFTPKVFVLDPTGYDPNYVQQAGSAANNTFVFSNAAMFEESGSNPELQLYTKWLHQVAPGAAPTYFGMFAWSSAELFTRLANQIGPNLTRPAMVKALSGVHNYTGNGLFAPAGRRRQEDLAVRAVHAVLRLAPGNGSPPAQAGVAGTSSTPASAETAAWMNVFLTYTVLGLVIGASYAIAASGLVLTYATTRIFNVAHGATAMVMAFVYWELAYNQGLSDWLAVAHRGVRGGAACSGRCWNAGSSAASRTPESASRWWSRARCWSG